MSSKILIPLALLSLTLYLYSTQLENSAHPLHSIWESWKLQHGKTYSTPEEDAYRFKVFTSTYNDIVSHNARLHETYKKALNKFSDLTAEEFKSIYLRPFPKEEGEDGVVHACPSNKNCPVYPTPTGSSLNWTATGAVTPVKDMLECGDVYAFSTTGTLEAVNYFKTGNLVSLSEQQINDCDKTNSGCDGGYPYLALLYTAKYGIETEAEYPYKGIDMKCRYNASLALHLNTGYECVTPKNASQLVAATAVMPVGVCVNAEASVWQSYSSGVISEECSDDIDHCLISTGYGVMDNMEVFYLKNEWGTSWGEHGYVYVAQNQSANDGYGVCGILTCSVIAQTS